MKKLILSGLSLFLLTVSGYSQGTDSPFFNLREFYTQTNLGTARTQAMGGAFTALGGDLNSTVMNPAGLGFFNNSEYSFSLNVLGDNVNTIYIGSSEATKNSPVELGQLAVVFSNAGNGSRIKRGNFAISYNNLASFKNNYRFNGVNSEHSIGDAFAQLANEDGKSPQNIEDDYDKNGFANYEYEMAYMAYIIDHFGNGYEPLELALPVNQEGTINKSGNLGQLNVGYGLNLDDRTYLGMSLGIQTLNYFSETVFDEYFPSNAMDNSRLYYENQLTLKGTGVNLGLGVIQRLGDHFNLGVSFTTPTIMGIEDSFEQYAGSQEAGTGTWTDTQTGVDELNYRTVSPMKANVGLSGFLPQRLGVISVEVEYVGYDKMNIKDKSAASWSSDQNKGIQEYYKDAVNFKAGMELRYGIGRLRAGFNMISDPLKNPASLNAPKYRNIGSLGLGVRNTRFFADVSYSFSESTGGYNPYILYDGNARIDYSVDINHHYNTIGFTIGSFF